MAELTYVKTGESIRSSTINNIIDALGGPDVPTDGGYIKTKRGSIFQSSRSVGAGYDLTLTEFLDVKLVDAPEEKELDCKAIWIQLGRDLDFAKAKLDVDKIIVYNASDDDEEVFAREIGESDFYVNGVDDSGAPYFYDGYVCTELTALQEFTVDTGTTDSSGKPVYDTAGYGDGTLYGYNVRAKVDEDLKKTLIITNEYEAQNAIDYCIGEGLIDEGTLESTAKLAVMTPDHDGSQLIKLPNDLTKEPDNIRFKLRGTIEKNDDGEKRFKVEYYQGYFLADDKDADTGVRWNNHQFNDITPDPALGWHTLSVSNWMSDISEKIPVYLNLTATYEPATGSGEDFNGQFEVSLKAAKESRSIPHRNEEEGTNSISSTYVIGQIDFEGESVKVKQNIIGEQTNIELFNEEAIEGALADLSSEYFSVDSALSVLQLSSIERHTYKDEDGAVLGHALEIYQFHDLENGRDIEEEDEDYTDIIVRRQSENGLPAEVQYMKFSSVLDEISNVCSGYVDQKLSGITGLSGDSQISVLQLSSIVVDTITHKIIDESGQEKVVSADAISMFKFNDPEGLGDQKHPWELSTHDFVLRKHDGSNMYLEYWPLSNVLSAGGGAEISVDTEIEDQTSSLQKLSTDEGEWYQLYNFDKSSVDLTVASDLNGPGRWYAPAPTGLTDTSALFLVKDTQSKQLKYAQLSVTPPAVDNCSIQRFWSPDFPGQPQMLSLNRFWNHPLDGTITGVLSSNNQLVTFSEPGGTGTFLMQNYLNGRLNLKYMKLQLSVDLSAVSADVKCDTDSTAAQKSIEKNAGYIQLHDFPSPTITTKKTTLDNLSATYDLLDSNDSILVRSGTELKYKKLQIETKLPGGSGPTSGYTGTKTQATNLKFNSNGQYKIELWGCDFQYENGLLKSIGNEKMITTLDTVGYSGQ